MARWLGTTERLKTWKSHSSWVRVANWKKKKKALWGQSIFTRPQWRRLGHYGLGLSSENVYWLLLGAFRQTATRLQASIIQGRLIHLEKGPPVEFEEATPAHLPSALHLYSGLIKRSGVAGVHVGFVVFELRRPSLRCHTRGIFIMTYFLVQWRPASPRIVICAIDAMDGNHHEK